MIGFRGRVDAAAFVVDVPVIGEAEARRRVIHLWQDGADLRLLPDDRWLLRLDRPVDVRAELAPGLPLTAVDGGLLAPGAATVRRGSVAWTWEGRARQEPIESLPRLNPAAWLDLEGIPVVELEPIEVPQPPIERLAPVEAPDLRSAGGVATRSRRAGRALSARLPSGRGQRVAGALATGGLATGGLLVLVAVVAVALPLILGSLRHFIVPFAIALVLLIRHGRRSRGSGDQARESGERPRGRWLSALLARLTPAVPFLRRRHERYLRELTRAFEQRRWEDALPDAVALGGGDGLLTLRLPKRRSTIRPSATRGGSAAGIPYGPLIHEHLRDLYRNAAVQLEGAGRVEEAAFVLADLLDAPGEAADLLERHDRRRMAAELAEGRELSPDLVVRLWWRAGDRRRATDLARTRGAFATGIRRLEAVDVVAALELRRAWVEERRAAGDHLGAVEAAWPVEELRCVEDIEAGIALGGPEGAHLLAYRLAFHPDEAARRTAEELLAGRDREGAVARGRFCAALAALADLGVADRELATAALRALVRDGGRAPEALRDRADPLAVADLAKPARRAVRHGELITAAGPPGPMPLLDAVVLGSGETLAAYGDAGTYLLSREGRTKARWDVPAHQLVVADHGGSALLVTRRESASGLHRLDLATRKVTYWATVHARTILPSYDGSLLIVDCEDGLCLFDTLRDRPRIVWRELPEAVIMALSRTPAGIAALAVTVTDQRPRAQVWRWDLPGWTLRSRTAADGTLANPHLLANGELLDLPGTILVDGDAYASVADGTAHVHGPVEFRAAFPGAGALGLRSHGGITTVFDAGGRTIAVDALGNVTGRGTIPGR